MTMPPSPAPAGPPTWRLGVAFGVVALLLAALILVTRADADPAAAHAVATTPERATTSLEAPVSSGSVPDADRVLAHTDEALAAWGLFAATGELDDVEATFAGGPQLEQLRSEAPDRVASGPGLPAFDFAMSDSEVVNVDGNVASVRTAVTMARRGADTAEFFWQIDLRWDEDRSRWMLYTVATVPEE